MNEHNIYKTFNGNVNMLLFKNYVTKCVCLQNHLTHRFLLSFVISDQYFQRMTIENHDQTLVNSSLTIPELDTGDSIKYVNYENELQMPDIMRLIQKVLSEPYSIYTYRYFIHNWPHLCFLVS